MGHPFGFVVYAAVRKVHPLGFVVNLKDVLCDIQAQTYVQKHIALLKFLVLSGPAR